MSDNGNESSEIIKKVQGILNSSDKNEGKLAQIRELVLEPEGVLVAFITEFKERVHRDVGNDSGAHFDLGDSLQGNGANRSGHKIISDSRYCWNKSYSMSAHDQPMFAG